MLDLKVIKSHWCVDIFPLHTNASSVAIFSSVLITHNISRKVRNIKITRIAPNTKLLKYLIPPPHASSNICGTQAEPCQFEIHKYFQGYCWTNNNNRKEGIIPTDGLSIKYATMHVNAIPHYPGNMQLRYIYRTCAKM